MRFTAHKKTDHRPRTSGRSSRGTAEIELLLALPLLLIILYLSAMALRLGTARVDNAFAAQQAALYDANSARDPQYGPSNELTPPAGIEAIRPDLPNRIHLATVSKTVRYNQFARGFGLVTVEDGNVDDQTAGNGQNAGNGQGGANPNDNGGSSSNTSSTGWVRLKPVTIQNRVAILAPSWAYSAFPFPDDRPILEDWFTRYVDESHADIAQPLGLQPAWTP